MHKLTKEPIYRCMFVNNKDTKFVSLRIGNSIVVGFVVINEEN